MALVELHHCGLYLFLYALHQLKLLSWVADSHNLLENLHCSSIRPLIGESRADMEHLQCLFIEPELLTDLEVIDPYLQVLLHIELYLLDALAMHEPDHSGDGGGEILVLEEEGDDEGRQGEFIE